MLLVASGALGAAWSTIGRTRGTTLAHDATLPRPTATDRAEPKRTSPVSPNEPATSVEDPAAPSSSPPVRGHVVDPASATPSIPSPKWRELAARGEHSQAYSVLGREGIAAEAKAATVEDLFALADVARLSGHPADAVGPLRRIVDDHGSDPRAALAALTLGRIELKSLGRPVEASAALRRAFALGVPRGLAEDAYGLLVEAAARSGDRAGARAAYEQYAAQFPHGSRLRELEGWVDAP
jgi:transmembrane sensor